MSNLLEQAIIDAAALKEAAYKSAIASLEDKYSEELKESVEKILEQGEEQQEMSMGEPQQEMSAEESERPSEEAFEKVKPSFLEGPDDELITISFDELKKEIKQALGAEESALEAPQASPEAVALGSQAPAPAEQQALQEEIELDDEILSNLSESIEIDDDIILEMAKSSCSYEEGEDELEEGLGDGQLGPDGDREGLEEAEASVNMTPTQLANTQNDAKEEQDKKAAELKRQEEINNAIEAAKKAQANAKNTSSAAEMAKKQEQDALRALQNLKSEQLEEEADIDMDYDGLRDTSGYLRTSLGDQKRQFNATLAKIKISLQEELGKIEEEKNKLTNKLKKAEEKNNELFSTVESYQDLIVNLKEEMENLSVSNAKLLYTNKVLGNNSLNERQKQTVVESLSRASSVIEAKTIYETLQSAVPTVSGKKQKESLSEALNRGPSPFAIRNRPSSVDDNFSDRMKILAGIKQL